MTPRQKKLLPSGYYDMLPPQAAQQSNAIARLLSSFAAFGYEQVEPPLMEFEDTLFAERGAELSGQTYRVMDPLSQAMMGFRADMTYQVARIALTRMTNAAHPLRLSYAGPILLVRPEPLTSERELVQAGFELIGIDSWEADAEAMLVAACSLKQLGVKGISLDINMPGVLANLLEQENSTAADTEALRDAIRKKDASRVPESFAHRATIQRLISETGPIKTALKALEDPSMPAFVHAYGKTIRSITERLTAAMPDLQITLDALESRGFDYHHGISFSVFAQGIRHELGRGGRYALTPETGKRVEATGFTHKVTHLLRLLPEAAPAKRIAVGAGEPFATLAKLQAEGYATVLVYGEDKPDAAAKRLQCGFVYDGSVKTAKGS